MSSARTNAKRKALLAKLKSGPCADCEGIFPPECMDFDHRNPEDKVFNIGRRKNPSLELLMKEIAKCDVVCANCHRIRTQGRKAWLSRKATIKINTPI